MVLAVYLFLRALGLRAVNDVFCYPSHDLDAIPLRLFFFFPLIQFREIVSELQVIIKTDVLNSTPKMNHAD